jgi:periplasmic divalent cation tolerance protein
MVVVLSNCSPERAEAIAEALVAERFAACVNLLGPVRSIYRWKGTVEREAEVTLLVKTSVERLDACVARLRALHPYELPEILVLPVDAERSLAPYVAWVRAESAPEPRG